MDLFRSEDFDWKSWRWNQVNTKNFHQFVESSSFLINRRFTFSTVRRKRKNRRKQDRDDDEVVEGDAERVSSQMTCHDIVAKNETFVKFVVYQKLEW